MNRLTFEGNFCDIAKCKNSHCEDKNCTQKQVWERLKEYEDTGLEPRQVRFAKDVIDAVFADDTSKIERVRKAMKSLEEKT